MAGARGRGIRAGVLVLVLVVGTVVALAWGLQRRLVYFPDATPVPAAADVIEGSSDVVLRTADGLELGAWFVPADPANDTGLAVLLAPGNAGNRAGRAGLAEQLSSRGLAVLLGHPTWTRRDARSVVEGRLLADPRLADLPRGALAWDLHASVSACPVPVALVAALGPYSALPEPDRSALLRLLPPARIAEFPGSHHVHLDHPDGWADAVDGFGASLL